MTDAATGEGVDDPDSTLQGKLFNSDKLALQNYGRPYDACSGKPTGTYYKFAKVPGAVPDF